MKKLIFIFILSSLLSGCKDNVYRYFCQDPNNFGSARCQKPLCEFNQDCPEYLVAPILEKKIEGNNLSVTQQQQGTAQCR